MEKVSYGGWENCIKLSNGSIELTITTDVGPRVIRLGYEGGQNFFFEDESALGKTGGDDWRLYGGHRLWHAPESAPRTYWPDNGPVPHDWDGKTLKLSQSVEGNTRIAKEIEIMLDPNADRVSLVHRLINHNPWDVRMAPWCLTVMAKTGRVIIPQEDFRPHPDYLLPARPLVLWHYTDMADPRWTWGTKYIQLQQDPGRAVKQKLGLLNSKGWTAYALNGEVMVKKFPFIKGTEHADMGCNTEIFTNEDMLEVETLGPLATLAADGGTAEHTEEWRLAKAEIDADEANIDAKLLPLVQ